MIAVFVACAFALLALALVLLLRPWQRDLAELADPLAGARAAALRLHRDQRAELDADLHAGTMEPGGDAEARAELQRRLLDEMHAAPEQAAVPASRARWSRRIDAVLVAVLPLAAALLYLSFGTPQALRPAAEDPMDRDIAALATRLEAGGGDLRGWLLLARSYRARDRLDDAERAYERAAALAGEVPELLVEHAELRAERGGGAIDDATRALLVRALAADGANPTALAMAAAAALQRHETAVATAHLRRLLPLLEPGSEDAEWVQARLDDVAATTRGTAPARP